jgi:hypothetical protein
MNYRIHPSALDSYLLDVWRRDGRRIRERRPYPVVYVDGVPISVNPTAILRIIIKGHELEALNDDEADLEPHLKNARGSLKGGKMLKRDKRFGLSADFWRWWHRVGKPQLGRDIASKEEADYWYRIYRESQQLIQSSWIAQFVPSLSYAEQTVARRLLSKLATDVVLGAL